MSRNRPYRQAGAVIVAGTVVWGVGISPAPRVYTTADSAARLALLERSRRVWVAGQFLTSAGTAAVPFGFAAFARALRPGPSKTLATAAATSLLAGAPLFIAAVSDRASDLERFAYRGGPAWPFLGYCGLHIVALGALGSALLRTPLKRWVGFLAAASAPLFGAVLLAKKDIPPFVFYLVEQAVGIYLCIYEEPTDAPGGPERA
ncbi:hypothetical protein [Pseudarthrobacter sp. N5]|uniref:hypothetical protein n=1 Tax=Pseudarthrobacter sp. N5 TaxID=3418416 RepID=UPI003CF89EAB